jgi:diaminopimelate decarboxylase
VGALAPGREVLLRINPGVGGGHHPHVVTGGAHSKFGIPLEELAPAVEAAEESGLVVRGLHAHIGSGIAEPAPLLASARRLLEAATQVPSVRVLDLGGGFAIPYRDGDREFDLAAYALGLEALLAEFTTRLPARFELWFEPGRFVVGPAGYLVAEVTCRKESGGLTFIGLDTGMNHLLRPALYGAYHRIVNLSAPKASLEWVEVVGNVCETTDVLASNRPVPRPEEGHLLAFLDVGAYGYSMASRYNLWPLPKEVALSAGREQA